jgi:hypothetical protein
VVLSLLASPAPGADIAAFRGEIEAIARIVERTPEASRPVPGQRLPLSWPPQGLELEVRASRKAGETLWARRIKLLIYTFFGFLVMRFGIRLGGFIPAKYTAN